MPNIPKDGWVLAGYFGVDAGLVWIGDPCYVLPEDTSPLGRDWGAFCDNLQDASGKCLDIVEFPEGFAISTGYGDGQYPVYVRKEDDRPMQIYIDFNILDD